jgi:osmotically-inducible protein OsmY
MQAAKRVLQMLISAVLLSVVLGCAGNAQKESTGEYVDDGWITSKVKAAFVKDKTLKASEINVETFKGTVQLSGFVADRGDVSHAGDVARGIKGVTSVKNDIRVM